MDPILIDMDVADLRDSAEAGLTDTVVLETSSRVRGLGAVYTTTWVPEVEQPGLLSPASAGGTNIRADQPSAAGEWTLELRAGARVRQGQQATVTGTTTDPDGNEVTWTRRLSVTKALFPVPHEVTRVALCVDLEANPT